MATMTQRTFAALVMSMSLLAAVPAGAAVPTQMWRCELNDGASEEDLEGAVKEWLKAARGMNGGSGFEAYVYFPVAVNATNQVDALIVLVAPSFEDWGKFWDAYQDSPASEVEAETHSKVVTCPDSVLWQSVKIE